MIWSRISFDSPVAHRLSSRAQCLSRKASGGRQPPVRIREDRGLTPPARPGATLPGQTLSDGGHPMSRRRAVLLISSLAALATSGGSWAGDDGPVVDRGVFRL